MADAAGLELELEPDMDLDHSAMVLDAPMDENDEADASERHGDATEEQSHVDSDNGEESDEESSQEEEEPSMVVSRARRSNAGRNLSKLIAQQGINEGDEDEQMQEIFAEIAGDDEFSGADAEDAGDISLESSSDEDEDDDDEDDDKGEKDLKKQERAERTQKTKKRKTMHSYFKPRPPKRPRIEKSVSVATPQDSTDAASRPRKKSERVSWIPTPDEGPTRASQRKLAVENKARTHERLKEKEKHRLHTLAIMKAADQRKEADKPKIMTQEDRLKEAAKVEARNSKSLNRWQESERIKEEERRERLEALKNKRMDGPVVRYWSGQSIWCGEKIQHVGKGAKVEEVEKEVNAREQAKYQKLLKKEEKEREEREKAAAAAASENISTIFPSPAPAFQFPQPETDIMIRQPDQPPPLPGTIMFPPPPTATGLLNSIEPWPTLPSGSQAPQQPAAPVPPPQNSTIPHIPPPLATVPPSVPLSSVPPAAPPSALPSAVPFTTIPPAAPSTTIPSAAPSTNVPPAAPPSTLSTGLQPAQPPPLPPPPQHLHASMAARTLVFLENFTFNSELSADAPVSKRERDRESLTRTLLTYNPLSATSGNFVRGKYAAVKQTTPCEITGRPARYRDPATGLAYHDSYAYKCIRRLVGGGCQWSGLVGAFVGPTTGEDGPGGRGRAAMGVPEVFLRKMGGVKKSTAPEVVTNGS